MVLNITQLAQQLQEMTELQEVPVTLDDQDYENYIIRAIKKLFIDTGRASTYDSSLVQYTKDGTIYNYEFQIDEQAYVLLLAQISFYKYVANDVNRLMGYTTDALTVTNADKPYANLKDTIANLQNERRVTYYKMSRYNLL